MLGRLKNDLTASSKVMSKSASWGISLDLRTLLIPCILTARIKDDDDEDEDEVVSRVASNDFKIDN